MMTERYVFWCGAGISIESRMPSGPHLTAAWLRHHLPDGEADHILDLFKRHGDLFGKDLPRLEKIVGDAVWAFGNDCLQNLAFFKDCPANPIHHAIADYVCREHGTVITTNFDTAIEDCHRGLIPVSTPSAGLVADWGVFKVHGSISESMAELGVTIDNLQGGLPTEWSAFLEAMLDTPDLTFVFVGYSGSDFFDISPLFKRRAREENPFVSRAIWLHFHPDHEAALNWSEDDLRDDLPPGAPDMLEAFDPARRQVLPGISRLHLETLLGRVIAEGEYGWKPSWTYHPTPDQQRRYAAKIYASLGMGRDSYRWALPAGTIVDGFTKDHQLVLNAMRDMGVYEAEYRLRQQAIQPVPSFQDQLTPLRHFCASARLAGHHMEAWRLYNGLLNTAAQKQPTMREQRTEILWCAAEAGLYFQSFATKLPHGWLLFP
ncbi:MAG: hypothetical protein K2Q10_04745, partial [Rhodospirillales bacterium]|nr:hypothetical protein [Rhodospirillales bacterium]